MATSHFLVEFAARYSRSHFNTWNAASALYRAQDLQYELDTLYELRDKAAKNDIFFDDYEIISYFAVGLVTCLEWHARSRRVDLLTFKPSCIDQNDLKGVGNLALSQMVAEQVTVPQLLGAATTISNVNSYASVFQRLFGELGLGVNIERTLRDAEDETGVSLYETLETLFKFRHRLVHEIDFSLIGHRVMRDTWPLDTAQEKCKAVIQCIKLIETQITEHAPAEFPNRLTTEGEPEEEFDKVEARIVELEDSIANTLASHEPDTGNYWTNALQAARAARAQEIEFLEKAEFLRPVRYYEVTGLFKLELLKTRLSFLSLVRAELNASFGDSEEEGDNAQ